MARVADDQVLYSAAERFRDRCLLSDQSLLWPDQSFWTFENLQELSNRIVLNYMAGSDKSFEDKLELQMQGASPALFGIIADMYYVYFLPSNSLKFQTKITSIEWAARKGGLTLPGQTSPEWEALTRGFSRTGQFYNRRINQIHFLIYLGIHVKQHAAPKNLFGNALILQNFVDGFPKKETSADMRHALLYLLFPDTYESIISSIMKQQITTFYQQKLGLQLPDDVDQALFQIRQKLTEQATPENPFVYFYRPPWDGWRQAEPPRVKIEVGKKNPEVPLQPVVRDEDVSRVLKTLRHTRNVILYGPPGTGKTYVARQAALVLIEDQLKKPVTEETVIRQAIEGLPFYDTLALAMYRNGSSQKMSVNGLLESPFVQIRYQLMPVKYPKESIWNNLQSHTSMTSKTVKVTRRAEPFLFEKDDQARWFLTEEGRQYVKENLSEQLKPLDSRNTETYKPEDFIKWVTFHQSYSYEDFIEGLRPTTSEDDPEKIAYEIKSGIFREICDLALNDPQHQYVLVIDEINRGNIAKIMGELITLLEDDKRAGQENALKITLPYSKKEFQVPGNLTMIGTMNTTDRSIALLDMALRRRFAFVEISPRPNLLAGKMVKVEDLELPLDALLTSLNRKICKLLDRDHQLGHSYFLKIDRSVDRLGTLEFVWNNQILPLLREYFYSRKEKLADLLSAFQVDSLVESDEPIGTAEGEDLMAALSKLAAEASGGMQVE